jgi:hypothetical protein
MASVAIRAVRGRVVETTFKAVGAAVMQGILRLRKCFAFAKHLLRSG